MNDECQDHNERPEWELLLPVAEEWKFDNGRQAK